MFPVHESFCNSLQAVESGFRRAAKDFEASWNGVSQLPFLCNGAQQIEAERISSKKILEDSGRKWNPSVFNVPTRIFQRRAHQKNVSEEAVSCAGCLHFAATWSLIIDSFVQALPSPFKSKKRLQKHGIKKNQACVKHGGEIYSGSKIIPPKDGQIPPLDVLACYLFENLLQSFQFCDQNGGEGSLKTSDQAAASNHLNVITGIIKGNTRNVDAFLSSMRFARVGAPPSNIVGVTCPEKEGNEEGEGGASVIAKEEPDNNSPQKIASGLLNIPLSNVERLRSTLSMLSLAELIEFVPQLGRPTREHPDKKKLFSVQDFFRYTESEGMASPTICLKLATLLS